MSVEPLVYSSEMSSYGKFKVSLPKRPWDIFGGISFQFLCDLTSFITRGNQRMKN